MGGHTKKYFNEFVLRQELKEELKRLEALRKDTVVALRRRNWLVRGAIVVTAVALFMILWKTLPPVAPLLLAMGALVLYALYGGCLIKEDKGDGSYAQEYKKVVGPHLLRSLDLDLEYRPDRGVPQERFLLAGFFSGRDYSHYCSEDCLEGKVGATQVQMAEVQAMRETEGSSGEMISTEIFCGWFVIADFPRPFRAPVVVEPRSVNSNPPGVWSVFSTRKLRTHSDQTFEESLEQVDNSDFEKMFVVHAADPGEAADLLTPGLKQRMLVFRASRGSGVRFAFRNSQLMIAIPNRVTGKDWFDPNPVKPASDVLQLNAIALSFVKQAKSCLGIVEELNLNPGA